MKDYKALCNDLAERLYYIRKYVTDIERSDFSPNKNDLPMILNRIKGMCNGRDPVRVPGGNEIKHPVEKAFLIPSNAQGVQADC